MQFTSIAALLAFAASVTAQTAGFDVISSPGDDENVPAGSTYTIKWAPGTSTGTVSISLMGGATSSTLDILSTIASSVDSSSGAYSWAVDSSLGAFATYGIKISLDSNTSTFQYSYPFHITGGSTSSSTVSGSTTTTSGSSATSGSSSASKSASTASTKTATTTSSYPTTTVASNSTASTTTKGSSGSGSTGAVTTLTSVTSVSATSSKTSATSVATNGASSHAGAGSLALIGGIAAAVFAL